MAWCEGPQSGLEYLNGGAVRDLSWEPIPVADSMGEERIPIDGSCTNALSEAV